MDKTDSRQAKPEERSGLSHLSSESAELFRRMTATGTKQSLRTLTPHFSEEEETVPALEPTIPAGEREGRTISAGSVPESPERNEKTGIRRFNLSSSPRNIHPKSGSRRAIHFPDLRETAPDGGFPQVPDEIPIARREQPDLTSSVNSSPTPVTVFPDSPLDEFDRIGEDSETPSAFGEAGQRSRGNGQGGIVEVSGLKKGYVKGKMMIPVLRGVDVQVQNGEFLSIVGQSGSGKSTLLHLMATLDVPDAGTVHFDGQRIDNLPGRQRDHLRNHYIGMIFQFYHLIPEMTMIENVLAPLMIRDSLFRYWRHRRSYIERAKELLDLVGLSHRIHHRPNELSGGEMQRTSIARALITEPRVLLADEPTGNLDSKTTVEIIKLLRSLNRDKKLTIIMVTHDLEQARDADRVIRLVDGQVVDNFRP